MNGAICAAAFVLHVGIGLAVGADPATASFAGAVGLFIAHRTFGLIGRDPAAA